MEVKSKCNGSLSCNTKMSLSDGDNNVTETTQIDDLYIANEKLCHDKNKNKLKPIQIDRSICSIIDTPDSKLDIRRILQLGCVMYAMVLNGMIYGYTSPAFPSLISKQKESLPNEKLSGANEDYVTMVQLQNGMDLTIDQLEASWVCSLSSLGFPVGAFLSSSFIYIMGKKLAAIIGQAGSYCIGYSLIAFAVNVECIYVGRFMCGICQVINSCCIIYKLISQIL